MRIVFDNYEAKQFKFSTVKVSYTIALVFFPTSCQRQFWSENERKCFNKRTRICFAMSSLQSLAAIDSHLSMREWAHPLHQLSHQVVQVSYLPNVRRSDEKSVCGKNASENSVALQIWNSWMPNKSVNEYTTQVWKNETSFLSKMIFKINFFYILL
jgi:hypothetical protein